MVVALKNSSSQNQNIPVVANNENVELRSQCCVFRFEVKLEIKLTITLKVNLKVKAETKNCTEADLGPKTFFLSL